MKSRSRKKQLVPRADAKSRPSALIYVAAMAGVLVLGGAGVWLYRYLTTDKPPVSESKKEEPKPDHAAAEKDPLELPPITPARFRNATPTAQYVGSTACLECHRDEHKSYLQTTHSRSLAEVDVPHEPDGGEFSHELSGRDYRIYRDQGSLRLQEVIHDPGGEKVILADQPAKYSLGSGNYARMYLIGQGDFLVEAPMTWYPRRKTWGMSAGYEKNPLQSGFNREIDANCLYCHAGRVETIGNAGLRLSVHEMAIGCERCHGPGDLHVKERRAERESGGGKKKPPNSAEVDDSIVNLRHLSRERQEDVCSQCHLSASADVNVHGRSRTDFRPGMKMADFVINYRIDRPDSAMTVSGQIEQMRLSRCYIDSKTMTCTTCHDPHSIPAESARTEHFRQKCLGCHQADSCGLPAKTRQEKQGNCIVCHMPRGPTDIPHFSFTHHRVGIHSEEAKQSKLTEADKLVPVVDVSHLPEIERRRLLGLANDVFGGKLATGLDDETRDDPSYRALAVVFQNRARQILDEVRSQGARDPEVDLFFSRLHWRKNPALCIEYAESALKSEHVSPAVRSMALYNLASSHFDQRRYAQAFPHLEELVKVERSEISLMLLGICHEKNGNLSEAVRLFNEAIAASPDRADLHDYLARIYENMRKPELAQRHRGMSKLLKEKVPQPQ